MNKVSRSARATACAGALVLAACSSPPVRNDYLERYPDADCSGSLRNKLYVTAEAVPLDLPSPFLAQNPLATHGALARRVVVSTIPNGLDRRYRITQSKLSLRSLGGVFLATLKLDTGHVSIDATQPVASRVMQGEDSGGERAVIETTPGQVTVTRDETTDIGALQSTVLDLLILPGDRTVEDVVLHVAELWSAPQRPLPSEALKLQLVPFRHSAGDEVEAVIDMTYELRRDNVAVTCAASTKATLVSKEATRQPLWDVGVAAPAGRKRWLVLYSPQRGITRLLFDEPTQATAFVAWLQLSASTQAGPFTLGLVEDVPPEAPARADASAPTTFSPLTAEEVALLKVGPIGER